MNLEDFKTLLDERGMSFNQLATKMGKERSVVYKTVQNGNPTLAFLAKLSEVLGMSIDEIVSYPQVQSADETNCNKDTQVDGFVEVDGNVHRIHSLDDMQNIINHILHEE